MSRIHVAAGLALVLGLSGCVGSQKIEGDREAPDLDRTLSTFVWIEEGDIASLIVNARIARYREDAPYVPFQIAVANHGMRLMDLTREAFELVDEEGNRYPCVGPRELLEEYEFLDLDRQPTLADLEGIVYDRFAAMTYYPSNFSPTRTAIRGTVRDRVTLPRHGFLVDFLYFPTPTTGVKGKRFELSMRVPEMSDPVFVKFEVR
jgi:hypothetical protein